MYDQILSTAINKLALVTLHICTNKIVCSSVKRSLIDLGKANIKHSQTGACESCWSGLFDRLSLTQYHQQTMEF